MFDVLCLNETVPSWHCVLILPNPLFEQVFMILTLELLVTFVAVAVCTLSENAKKFVQANPWMMYLSFFVNLAVLIVLSCFRNFSRKHPWNLVALVGITGPLLRPHNMQVRIIHKDKMFLCVLQSIFTLTSSYMVGMIASFYDTEIVVMAVGITAVVCSAVMLFSLQVSSSSL